MLDHDQEPQNLATTSSRSSLDGKWEARMCDPGVGEAEGWAEQAFESELTVLVPGQVQVDLIREGIEPDFNFGENARVFGSREGKDWWLSREFEVEQPNGRSELVFHGLDTVADAWLNGVHLGRHRSAHKSWQIDVTAALKKGANRLVVRLDDGSRWAAGRELERYSGLEGVDFSESAARIWVRKPQYVWKWDWSPRLLTCGIWRSVELREYDTVILRDVRMKTEFADTGAATVTASCELECLADAGEGSIEVVLNGKSGRHLATAPISLLRGVQEVSASIEIPEPARWWPAPLGEPSLYDVSVCVRGSAGSDCQKFRYGLRTIELERRDLGEDGQSFVFVVNGVPVFCKGSGWNPRSTSSAMSPRTSFAT